jgi:eukaryotic-like serine/threonine-protein kinase
MKLVFTQGPHAGARYTIEGAITVGRDASNDIVLPDQAVSLVHCQIINTPDRRQIKDMGSTNGTFVNGERVVSRALTDGDGVLLGANHIRIELPPLSTTRRTAMASAAPPGDGAFTGSIDSAVQYFLKRKITDGGMGSIYEAEQIGAEGFIKRVAIKTILPEFAAKPDFVSSFIGEARLVANLVHQNIVQIHHLGRMENGYYIAMEYIDGINLCDFIDEHAALARDIPADVAAFIISRVCRGLDYAHRKCDEQGRSLGLVHRDVSPRNIMIEQEGEVKLSDFGVAKAAYFMEPDEEMLVGSVEYMSPEQAQCGIVDARSDLFSLGLVFYELLTGVRAFCCHGGDIDATVARVIRDDVPSPRQYRPSLDDDSTDLVMKCLARDPAARFASAGELGNALEELLYTDGYGLTVMKLADYVRALHAEYAAHQAADDE